VKLSKKKIFYLLISGAILIFGLSSSPTPKVFSLPISISGLFLILSVLMFGKIFFKLSYHFRTFSFLLFFLFFLTIPNFVGFLNGNAFDDIVRDFLSFLFLFLFILWLPIIKLDTTQFLNLIVKLLIFLGLIFSIKYLALQDFRLSRLTYFTISEGHFSHDPSVLFSAIYFSIEGLRLFNNNKKINSLIFSFFGLICFLPLLLTGFRLQIFLFIFVYFFSFIIYSWFKPKIFFFYIIIFLCIIFPIHEYITIAFSNLYEKQLNLGFNNRFKEFSVLTGEEKIYLYLIGEGWGGLFSTVVNSFSPLRFVHNFSLYFFYKAGVIGLLFSIILIVFSFRVVLILFINYLLNLKLNYSNKYYPVLIAIIPCLIYTFFFSGAFKSLSMGLLLVLVNCFYFYQKNNKAI
jgi:hypothetical protein